MSADARVADGDARRLTHYLGHLRVERGLAANTVAAYRRDLTRYLAHLAASGTTADLACPEHITGFLQAVRTGADGGRAVAASSASRMLASVRGFHRFLEDEGESNTGDPAAAVPPPALPLRLPHALSVDEVEALIAAAGSERGSRHTASRALRDRALVELLYGVGARISEALGLDLDDLDLEARMVRLRGKGDKQRIVPVGTYAAGAVGAYLSRARPELAAAGSGTPALFLGSRGTRLTRQAAWTMIQQAAREAEIPSEVSPHSLRHSYATHLLRGGADVRTVQELLGHASVATTQLYTQVTVDSLREAHALAHPRARSAPEV